MKTKLHTYIGIIFFIFLSGVYAQDENIDYKKLYKIEKQKENIACLVPYVIDGIDKIYIKNTEGDIAFIIELMGSEGSCYMESDKLVFKKNTDIAIVNNIIDNFEKKIYIDNKFRLNYRITQVNKNGRTEKRSITIPYFIVLKNKDTDEIISQNTYKIQIPLNLPLGYGNARIYETRNLTLKTIVPEKQFGSIRLVSGIYFKDSKNYGKAS